MFLCEATETFIHFSFYSTESDSHPEHEAVDQEGASSDFCLHARKPSDANISRTSFSKSRACLGRHQSDIGGWGKNKKPNRILAAVTAQALISPVNVVFKVVLFS